MILLSADAIAESKITNNETAMVKLPPVVGLFWRLDTSRSWKYCSWAYSLKFEVKEILVQILLQIAIRIILALVKLMKGLISWK